MPALATNANGDLWSIAGLTVPGAAGAMGGWFYPTSSTARQRIFSQFGTIDVAFNFRADLAGDPIYAYLEGSTYGEAQANAASFAHYALNTWMYWLFTWSTSETSKLWVGNLTNPPAEPSAYTTQTTIVGPPSASGTAYFLNENVGSARYFVGRCACFHIYPFVPNQSERYRLWRGEIVPGATYFGVPGMNGTTNVPDMSSGNRTGTITSLDLAVGPSLVFPCYRWEGEAYAVAAAPAPTTRAWFLPLLGAA